ncbi:MAG: hypothetical protein EP343_02440 [Deltaproteobacteria bacterium]|nr:MAG: hypothetical protein EP343_02440 [Deltaproteobacteria bacterium]
MEATNNTESQAKTHPLLQGLQVLVLLALFLGIGFGGLTCGIKLFASKETYQLWLYRNNIKSGNYQTFHKNGKVASIQPYANGKTNGVARFFDAKGRLLKTITYKRGRRNGPYVLYHTNGQVKERGQYVQGKKFGAADFFDAAGKPLTP